MSWTLHSGKHEDSHRIRILDFRIFRHFLEFIVPDEFFTVYK